MKCYHTHDEKQFPADCHKQIEPIPAPDERDHQETVETEASGGAREDISHKFTS